jgi:hypothetical protein
MKRCNAKTRKGTPCQRYPLKGVKNNRCRLHGGLSTGAKTKAGKERQLVAKLKHGYYSESTIKLRKRLQQLLIEAKQIVLNVTT